MLIYEASAPPARETFLHAGYGSASNDFADFDPAVYSATGGTGITQSGMHALAIPEINAVLILVFFGGLALLARAKQVPRKWRWVVASAVTGLLIMLLVMMYHVPVHGDYFN